MFGTLLAGPSLSLLLSLWWRLLCFSVMMSPDDRALDDLLYGSDLGDEVEGAELGGGAVSAEESAGANNVNIKFIYSII